MDSSRKLREMFSKKCFETLLKYSFVTDGNTEEVADGTLNNMALASMLNRCKDIMQRYAHDESLNGTVPLPRARTNEMICVLNSLCTLIGSLKKAPKDCGMKFLNLKNIFWVLFFLQFKIQFGIKLLAFIHASLNVQLRHLLRYAQQLRKHFIIISRYWRHRLVNESITNSHTHSAHHYSLIIYYILYFIFKTNN